MAGSITVLYAVADWAVRNNGGPSVPGANIKAIEETPTKRVR